MSHHMPETHIDTTEVDPYWLEPLGADNGRGDAPAYDRTFDNAVIMLEACGVTFSQPDLFSGVWWLCGHAGERLRLTPKGERSTALQAAEAALRLVDESSGLCGWTLESVEVPRADGAAW